MFGRPTRLSRIVCQTLATLIALPFAVPLVALVAMSFQGQGAVANYTAVITQSPFLRFLVNTVVFAAGTIVIVYVCTMLAGYAFSKLDFRGRGLLFGAILVGLILPAIALIVPLFTIYARLKLFNNYVAIMVPLAAVLIPLTLLLAKNYIDGIPDEIIEAARIDGATSFGALFRIVIPLSRPITAVVVVWAFLNAWNEFFLPLLFLQDESLQVLTQVPTYFTNTYGSDVPKIFASLVLISLPVVIAYLCLQRYFERGLSAGAIK
ncbi:MAG: carbohydrate ABC transporter permease [Microbacterium sp.]|uniref:carbohydrate ABC transporter permease n=1 Tax=Microbacterium sp. TaxID=51671 RepID=UPI0039E71191